MSQHITARKVEEIPQTASVSDYDELPEDGQKAVRRLVAGESVEDGVPSALDNEVVRFGDYYRIDSAGAQASD